LSLFSGLLKVTLLVCIRWDSSKQLYFVSKVMNKKDYLTKLDLPVNYMIEETYEGTGA
jgi:hypothetical protein